MEYDFSVQLKSKTPPTQEEINFSKQCAEENGYEFGLARAIAGKTRYVFAYVERENTYPYSTLIFEDDIDEFLKVHEFVKIMNPPNNNLPVFRKI
ncbi:MAG: hypothetical protein QXN55_00965 [Candidatus Nitrosotenuis sp.]